jgi:hypothetical protein
MGMRRSSLGNLQSAIFDLKIDFGFRLSALGSGLLAGPTDSPVLR